MLDFRRGVAALHLGNGFGDPVATVTVVEVTVRMVDGALLSIEHQGHGLIGQGAVNGHG